jgi:hypothetical protein
VAGYALKETETDLYPYEVLEIRTDRIMILREMVCDLANGWRPRWIMGHCVNQDEQDWEITPDEKAIQFPIRYTKKHGWRDSNGNVYTFTDEPRRWHCFHKLGGVY